MSENNRQERGFHLPNPLERIRHTGQAVVNIFANDHDYFERQRQDMQQAKEAEEKLYIDLRDRVGNFAEQEAIEAAKSNHPSSRGYL